MRAPSSRKRLFSLHSWVGFHLAILMSVVLATGTLATVSHEIDWLLRDQMRVPATEPFAGWRTLEASVRAAAAGDTLVSLGAVAGNGFAYRARLIDEHGRHYFMHIDPVTATVQGTMHTLTVQRFFRDLHRYLYMPSVLGLPIVTSMAFVLAISLYTGLKTTRNWRTLALRVRFRRGARVAVGDGHKALGLWGIWFFVIIIATSLWYLGEFGAIVGGGRFEPERPKLTESRLQHLGPLAVDRDLGEVMSAVEAHFPELEPTNVFFPTAADQPIAVLGRRGNPLLRDRANRIFLDPVSLEPLTIQRSSEIGWVSWLNEIADPLHFGYFGGLVTKLIWFVFGCAMTAMSITGVWLTLRRLEPDRLSKTQLATVPVLALAAVFSVSWYQRLDDPNPLRGGQVYRAAIAPSFTGELRVVAPAADAEPIPLKLLLESTVGRPVIRSLQLEHPSLDEPLALAVRQSGRRLVVRDQLPTSTDWSREPFTLTVTFHDQSIARQTLEPVPLAATIKRGRQPST